MSTVCVLGDGSWGTALATVLAHNGHNVMLWCYDKQIAQSIQQKRYNHRYLPDIYLPESIVATTCLQDSLRQAEYIFEAIPVKFLRSVIQNAQPYFTPSSKLIVFSKGIESGTLLLPSQLIDSVAGMRRTRAIIAGPSYAHLLARKQPTAMNVSVLTDNGSDAKLITLLTNEYCKLYSISDGTGMQLCAAFKNIIALMIGMLDGAGYGDNIKAFVFTRAIQEMKLFVKALGGKEDTVYDLCGVGDLVLTVFGKHSKNQEVGRQLGSGKSLDSIIQTMPVMPEGINTLQSISQLQQQYQLELPLCRSVYRCVFERSSIEQMLHDLNAH